MELLDLAAAGDQAEMGGRADGILTTGVAKYQSGHNTAAMGTQYDSFVDVYRRDATVQARLEVLGEADLPASDRVIAVRLILRAVWLQAGPSSHIVCNSITLSTQGMLTSKNSFKDSLEAALKLCQAPGAIGIILTK